MMTPPAVPLTGLDALVEAMLRRDEGVRYEVYDDATGLAIKPGSHVVGHPTIGCGRALDEKGVSPGELNYLLYGDILDAKHWPAAHFPWFAKMEVPRQAVVVCMYFQLGTGGVAEFPKFLAACAQLDWTTAAAEMRDSTWAKETPDRVARLAKQMETGEYQA